MMCSGWARSPSAATTPSSAVTPSPAWRSRKAAAAAPNAASSTRAMMTAAREGCPATTTISRPAAAAAPASDPRSAHGPGSAAGRVPLNCLARPRPAVPPSAVARPHSSSQRSSAVTHAAGAASAGPAASPLITGVTVPPQAYRHDAASGDVTGGLPYPGEQLGEVHRTAPGELRNLGPAGEPVGEQDGAGR